MRLISLTLSNFRVIKSVKLEFPDRVIGIIGPNGAGKSTIIEAIAWALYGNQAARSGKDEIKSAFAGVGDNCEVCLDFSVNEERYRVIRRLVGRTERAEVELYRGESSESVGVNETRAYVGQLLGLDWRGFLSSFLARQQELNALSDLQPSKRRDHIAGMLGIERLDKAIQRVKEDAKLNQEKGRFLEGQLAHKEQVAARIEELTQVVSDLEGPILKLQTALGVAETDFKAVKKRYEESQELKEQWLKLQAKIDAEERTRLNLSEQIEAARKELTELQTGQAAAEDLQRKLTGLGDARSELDRLKEIKSQVALKEELTGRKSELESQEKTLSKQLEDLGRKGYQLEDRIKALPENLDALLAEANRELEAAREEYSRVSAEAKSARKDSENLERQLSSIAELGPESVCERCRRPFGNDYDRIWGHLKQELDDLAAGAAKMEKALSSMKTKGEQRRMRVAELESQKKDFYQLEVDRQALTRERENLARQLEETGRQKRQAANQLNKYESLQFDPQRFETVAAKVEQLEKVQQEFNQLKGRVSRLPTVQSNIDDLTRKLEQVKHNQGVFTNQLSGLGVSETQFEELNVQFNRSQERLEAARREHLATAKEKELNERELAAKQERLAEFDKTAKELEKARAGHFLGEKLSGLFAEFRKQLIASIRPSLADMSSQLMSDMTEGRYSLIDLDEQYNLRVMDNGVYYGVDRFSGGEKDLANLCLRLAISLALTESAGLTRSFVILDEVFGSQDEQRKDLILRAMGKLKSRFPQILLITHVDDVKDGVEEIVEVLPSGTGWSEVRINGATQ